MMIPLWRQLQSTAHVLQAVRAGESGTAAIAAVSIDLRPGVQSLSFHVWRWLGTAEIIRAMLAKRPPPPQVDALLCVALALMCSDTEQLYEPFTLVDQAVEAAKRNPDTKASSSFINACLRRFLREKDAMTAQAMQNPVGRWNHPAWWIKRLKADHPNDWQTILRTNNARAPFTLRVNAKKTSVVGYLHGLLATNIIAIQAGKYGITLTKPTPVQALPGFADGHVSVQDAAAQLAAPLLVTGLLNRADAGRGTGENVGQTARLENHLKILDACAAPGGKTAHLLELGDFDVTALDIDPERCDKIHLTLNRLGLHAQVCVADAAKPATWPDVLQKTQFDGILLDAPCSASGIVRRHPDIRWLRRESDIAQLAQIQSDLLQVLWQRLKPGGHLLYCTCSVFKAEGQDQIDKFLVANKNASLKPPSPNLPYTGHLIAKTDATAKPKLNQAESADHALTNHDGFFYALLEKITS